MNERQENNMIRTMVRGAYDLQKLRIQSGNRIVANFKSKLGQIPGTSEKDLEKEEQKLLEKLRESYNRITDGLINEKTDILSPKKFVGDELISTYTEMVLVSEYVNLLKNEQSQFKKLGYVLEEVPIYTEFLSGINGLGVAMAGIIISEIDIHKAEYPSSLWKYAGLDCAMVCTYIDDKGKEHTYPLWKIELQYEDGDLSKPPMVDGKYPVTIKSVGRSRRDFCLVEREYINKDGNLAKKNSITYNPFLKTKLMGVLAGSFLKGSVTLINGERMGTAKRLALAKELGYTTSDEDEGVDAFLRSKGYVVEVIRSKYAEAYYNYKNRINNDPRHASKTPSHKHQMALRYMVKRFLVDLYTYWRALEGLPVAPEYSEGKLGMIHLKA